MASAGISTNYSSPYTSNRFLGDADMSYGKSTSHSYSSTGRNTYSPSTYVSNRSSTYESGTTRHGSGSSYGSSYGSSSRATSRDISSSYKPFESPYTSTYSVSYPTTVGSSSMRTLPPLNLNRTTPSSPSYARNYERSSSGRLTGGDQLDTGRGTLTHRSRVDSGSRAEPLRATDSFKTTQDRYMSNTRSTLYGTDRSDRPPLSSYELSSSTSVKDRVASLQRSLSTIDLAGNLASSHLSERRSSRVDKETDDDRLTNGPYSVDNNHGVNGGTAGFYGRRESIKDSIVNDWSPSYSTRPSPPSSDPAASENRKRFSSVDRHGTSSVTSKPSTGRACAGLRNLGNTCFMNSVLQCLAHTRSLLDYCTNDSRFESEINSETSRMKGLLVSAFANLMKTMWTSTDGVSPIDFKSEIARFAKRFVGYNQQDAQEFLIYLLEGLHEDLNRVRDKSLKRYIDNGNQVELISAAEKARDSWKAYTDFDNSIIVDIFVGQLKSELTCLQCNYVSNTFDPFLDLSLPIKQGRNSYTDVSLLSCFELFTQEETMDGDEKPMCARCKTRQACKKRLSIQRFPNILIIHLKRFSQDYSYRSKLSTEVKCPIRSLDLAKFASSSTANDSTGSRGAVYDLYALSNHSGTPSGGHYTASALDLGTADWHHFNDHKVSHIKEADVVTSEAYILFYKLSSSSSSSFPPSTSKW